MKTRSSPFDFGLMVFIVLLIAAAGIHFAFIQNVWIDESTQLSGIKLGISRLLLWLSGTPIPEFGVPADRMPPVSYIVDGVFGRIAGFQPVGFRLLHLAITISGTLALVVTVLRRFELPAATATGVFLALSPKLIETSVEIRAYPIFLAITCFQIVVFIQMYERDRTSLPRIGGFALLGLLSAYTHFFGIVSTSAFFTALFLGARDRKSAAVISAVYIVFLTLCIGLAPFIAGATSISTVTERSVVSATGLVEFALKLVGHSSTMLSTPAALIYFAATMSMIGLTLFGVARHFRDKGLAARTNPVFGIAVALAAGLCATIAAALVVTGFDPLKISYNIWTLPLIAVLIGAALAPTASKLIKTLQAGFASLLLLGALWTHGMFLIHANWFVHGPEKTLVAEIDSAGPRTAVVYDGVSWGYGYFPLYWRFRDAVPQWLIADNGASIRRIDRGGHIGESQPLAALNQFNHLVYARIETKTYDDLKAYKNRRIVTSEPSHPAHAFNKNGWRVGPVVQKPGLYWLTSTTLDRAGNQ